MSVMGPLRGSGTARQIRIALRKIVRAPAYSTVVILSLALGIGLCAAAFSLVNGVMLRPLPYDEPDDLLQVWTVLDELAGDRGTVTAAAFRAWRREGTDVADVAAHNVWSPILSGTDGAEQLTGERITPGLFRLLGTEPFLGGALVSDHGVSGNHRVVLLGYDFWRNRFGEDRSVLGRTITLDDEPYVVIGVMPPDFHHPDPHRPLDAVDVFAPLVLSADVLPQDVPLLRVVARARPNRSADAVRTRLHQIVMDAGVERTSGGTITGIRTVPLRDEFFRHLKRPLYLLLAATGLVLLIIATNVAHLALVRARARMGATAIRRALGAKTRDLLRPLLWESVLLAGAAAVLGMLLVFATGGVLQSIAGRYLPAMTDVRPDATVLLFAAVLAAGLTLVLTAVPLLTMRRLDIRSLLAGRAGTGGTPGRSRHAAGRALGTAEIALAVALAIGTALLTRSLLHLNSVDPGFGGDALAVEVFAPPERYASQEQVQLFYEELERELVALPGVSTVGRTSDLPLIGQDRSWAVQAPGSGEDGTEAAVEFEVVGPGYFQAAGIPVLAGRGFTERDASGRHAVVVSESLARQLGQGDPILGREVDLPGSPAGERARVLGIVGDVRDDGLGSSAEPRLYLLHGQWPGRRFVLVLRRDRPAGTLAADVRRTIATVGPGVPILSVQTLTDIVDRSLRTQRLAFASAWAIGLIAVLLAILGVYGTVAYITQRRTKEIGIRIALGADPARVVRLVLRDGLTMIVPGVAIGVLVDVVATRVLLSMIFGIGPLDPPSFVVAPACIIGAGLLASYLPARGAARIDPLDAIRADAE